MADEIPRIGLAAAHLAPIGLEQLPSSEDLAAEFERYLRELDDPPS